MNLENIMQSERRQTPRVTYCMVPFSWNIQKRRIHRDRKQLVIGRNEGYRGRETNSLGMKFLFGVMKWSVTRCRRKQQPTPVFLLGKSHEPRSLVDYSPWGCKGRHDWATTQQQITTLWMYYITLNCSLLKVKNVSFMLYEFYLNKKYKLKINFNLP